MVIFVPTLPNMPSSVNDGAASEVTSRNRGSHRTGIAGRAAAQRLVDRAQRGIAWQVDPGMQDVLLQGLHR
jgi:hypothetical protein